MSSLNLKKKLIETFNEKIIHKAEKKIKLINPIEMDEFLFKEKGYIALSEEPDEQDEWTKNNIKRKIQLSNNEM